ncbi:MAG: DUF63 family protein, partial [Halonotius sp.]
MTSITDRLDTAPERLWLATFATITAALVGGSLLFRDLVWDRFLWQYFWGPVAADGNGAVCAVNGASGVEYLASTAACTASQAAGKVVAYPGYTLVSEVGYILILLFALVGVYLMLDRLEIGDSRELFYALVPFILFGGALRTIEDAAVAARSSGFDPLIQFPASAVIISPFIYGTMFLLTLAAIGVGIGLASRGLVERYEYPVFAIGVTLLTLSVGYLTYVGLTTSYATVNLQVLGAVLVGATLAAGLTWALINGVQPSINDGTGLMGLVVIWGHAVDGTANVIGLDWMPALGAGRNLVPKHPVNAAVVDITGSVLPPSVLAVTGDTWPFLVLKLAAATFVVWVFEPELFDETPRYSILLLIAV